MAAVPTIAHISDPHVGSPFFVPNLMNRVIVELNEMEPDAVVCSGDLTTDGYRQEYKNCAAYLSRIRRPVYVVPGTGRRWWWMAKILRSAGPAKCSRIQS